MTYVDSAVLDFTERMCRRFQAWTGRTNVWLAFQLTNLSVVVYFIWVAGLYLLSRDVVLRVFVALFCGGVFFVLTRTIFRTSIELSETEAYRRVAKGLRNPRRLRDAPLRMSFLMLAVLWYLTLGLLLAYPVLFVYVKLRVHLLVLSYLLIALTTLLLYLLACDPLPPCAGKVKEWLNAAVRALNPVSDPATAE